MKILLGSKMRHRMYLCATVFSPLKGLTMQVQSDLGQLEDLTTGAVLTAKRAA